MTINIEVPLKRQWWLFFRFEVQLGPSHIEAYKMHTPILAFLCPSAGGEVSSAFRFAPPPPSWDTSTYVDDSPAAVTFDAASTPAETGTVAA